ncbi:hypothetical protein UA32_12670 [Photobacterium angustum]|uniref:Uncharacterized protein n=1 Tax=Photobacterium angustum TaxID=661 RepID=A0ABX5H168_PHOAN|nr:hypothetical protein [Photobacterium angustum]KJG37797.1 hypothetical protein UA32_12670 [Photobacterium angustum]PSX07068.1 hypothetical protein C0W27_15985 [Photobacterium angustum]
MDRSIGYDLHIQLLDNASVILGIVSILCLLYALYHYYQYRRGIAAAKIIIETQHNPAEDSVIDALIQQEKRNGNEQYVFKLLTVIKRQYGVVKVGHIMFIVQLLDKGCPDIDDADIPPF